MKVPHFVRVVLWWGLACLAGFEDGEVLYFAGRVIIGVAWLAGT